jgi:hypothetical protein
MTFELKEYRTESGIKTAIVKPSGPKWMHVMIMDGTLSVQKVPATEERYMTSMVRRNNPYPLSRAIKVFRNYGRTHGKSKGAKRFLSEATKQEQDNATSNICKESTQEEPCLQEG